MKSTSQSTTFLPTLRAGELARACGVSTDTLRHYERVGVLPKPQRTSAGYRQYPTEAQVRVAESLPMKLAVFDGESGLLALLDPVITRPTWTAVVFRHDGMGEAMKALFEERWRRGTDL